VNIGAHLPLMDFGGHPYTVEHLTSYARTAARLGFDALTANDHLVYSVPWLDGPSAIAAVMDHSADLTLATTVSLPVVRGPVALAKTLGAIDRLSHGRLLVGVGPGSSRQDYAAVGIDFDERWGRFDESIQTLRALWRGDKEPFVGRYYSTAGVELEPRPTQAGGPPIWIGSWGSDAGLRRVARLGDGWLASAYNTTPELFAEAWSKLQALLVEQEKNVEAFPNALATMWFHITDDAREADRIMRERLAPTINRPVEMLQERLPVGPSERFAEKLVSFAKAGVQRVFIWPVADEHEQLERFARTVRPLIHS
jgi:alkanesulfonate monooxygenase SsuD/methylene tetrahydromethanopterin reductase-like flavin-dependent oxidoreductase (luciferase family)